MNEVYVVTVGLAGLIAAILGGALPLASRVGAAVALTWLSCGAGIAAAVSDVYKRQPSCAVTRHVTATNNETLS